MIIDLSVLVNEQTPVYPGDPPVLIKPTNAVEKNGFTDHTVTIGTHAGTHVDAPSHMIAGGKTLDQFPIEQFVGRGRLVPVENEFNLKQLQAIDIQPGDIVLFYTGMGAHFHEPTYFTDHPAITNEIARYLVAQKVSMVGVDTGSVDNTDGFPIHKILLGGDVLAIENLTNLDQLKDKTFTVYALPLKLGIDAAPCRVVAQTH